MSLTRWTAWFSLMSFWTALAVPTIVSANMTVEPSLGGPVSGILTLIALNFSVDLMLIAAGVYAAFSITNGRAGDIPGEVRPFIGSILLATVVVAATGGVIDFAFLYEAADDHYVLKELSAEVILVPAVLIFAAIAASLHMSVRIRPTVSLGIAAVIAPLSPIGWWMMSGLFASPYTLFWGIVSTVVATVMAVFLLITLKNLHGRAISGELDKAYEGGTP